MIGSTTSARAAALPLPWQRRSRRAWHVLTALRVSARHVSAWRVSALCVTALGATALPGALRAQQPRAHISGSIETGAAAIEQPLVRRGAAFYVAPRAQLTAHDFAIGGTAVLATGMPTWRSLLGTGFVRTPSIGNVRIVGSGQLLKTSGLAHTVHGDVGAEWHAGTGAGVLLLRARTGQLRYAGTWWRDMDAGASAMHTRGSLSLVLDATWSSAFRPTALQEQLGAATGGGTSFRARTLDLTPRMIWERSRLRADASLALRAAEGVVRGTRVGPQLSFTWQTARGISLFVGGVQRLPDVRAGIPSGRSALLGLRVEARRVLVRPRAVAASAPTLRIEKGILLLDTGTGQHASRAALRGDFTAWSPRTCRVRAAHLFDCGTAPVAGAWRVSIRVNDGAWLQPGNLPAAADDFGSVDGVLLTGGKP